MADPVVVVQEKEVKKTIGAEALSDDGDTLRADFKPRTLRERMLIRMITEQRTEIDRLHTDKVRMTEIMGETHKKIRKAELNAVLSEEKFLAVVDFLKAHPVGKDIDFTPLLRDSAITQ
jgi:hypothetical protein